MYLTAHTNPESSIGLAELDQMARACGTQPAELPATLDRLAATDCWGHGRLWGAHHYGNTQAVGLAPDWFMVPYRPRTEDLIRAARQLPHRCEW